MKKNYIFILVCLTLCISKLKAQCTTIITASDTVICAGDTVMLYSGTSGMATYAWSNGAVTVSNIVYPSSTSVYTLTTTNSIGCVSTSSITITVNPTPIVTVSSSGNICAGGTATLTASGANTYTWVPGNINTFSVVVNPTASTTYTVIGDIGGCTSTATVGVLASPPINLSVTTTDATCGACNGSVSLNNLTGGSPPYTYTWLPMGIYTTSAGNLCAGNYSVAIMDANGCKDTTSLTIASIASPILTLTESSTTICAGDSATLSATGAVSYFWYPYNSLNDSLISTVIAKPTVTTTYTITGYDANNCSTMAYLTLSVMPTPTVGFAMQRDTTQTGVWYAQATYANNVTNVIWYWGDGTSTQAPSPSHTYSVAGQYNICVTAFNSCGDSANICQNDSLYRLSQNSSGMISVTVISNATTGINQLVTSNKQISIYPNPTTGTFTIETNSASKQTLQIVDINGRIVLTQTINGKANIDASSLKEGVYNINILGNGSATNKRLVIVK